jgi:peptidoglycan/LPS O-acetylase OafA/YrhL
MADVDKSPVLHFWSLSVEEQFYLVWPVVVRFVAPRRIVPLCGAIMVGALALRCWMVATGRSDPYHVTLARVDALAAGALVAALRRDPGRFSRVVRYAPHAAILAAPLALSHPLDVLGPTVGYTGVAVLSACVIARAAADPNGSAAWALSRSSVLRRFGLYSYGLYVVHVPIILLLAAGGVRPATLGATLGAYWLGAVAFFALAVAMSLAVAVPSWHYFESRFLRRGAASRELVRPLCPPARIAD